MPGPEALVRLVSLASLCGRLSAFVVLLVPFHAVSAQLPPAATRDAGPRVVAIQPPSATRGPRDPAEVEAFMDGLMAAWMRDKHVAGVTVSVVRDGQILLAKGYGYADVAKRKPVDPERTLFRIGSVSKLFTWTGVMQLHERGIVDLTRDVNAYLDFSIPAAYDEPITLTHILTHTPGLEEDPRGLFSEDSARIVPMGQWLPAHMPARVRAPGTFASYSNWATAVAGYIIERKGGTPSWDAYTERHILQPLGMVHTTTRQPLPPHLAGDMSVGYEWKQGEFVPRKFEIINGAAPAGSVSASAADMARFMIAHLNRGALGEARILGEREAELMQSRLHGHDPRIPGFAHGFYEQSSHGLRIIGHGGDTQWFHSNLSLIPNEGVGVFMSTNTSTGGEISFLPFLTAFLDHYYPESLSPNMPKAEDAPSLARYAGEYVFNRRSYTTYFKAAALAGAVTVSPMKDGTLAAKTPFGVMRLVREDSLLFRDITSGMRIAFRADDRGTIQHAFLDAAPMMVMDRMSRAASPSTHMVLLGGGLLVFLVIVATGVVRFFLRNVPGRPRVEAHVARGRRALIVAGVLMLAFVGALAAILSGPGAIFAETTVALRVALALPVLALLAALWGAWEMLAQWRLDEGSVWTRLRHTAAVLVALAFFWSMYSWNLLGWKT
jgi:CubicO group peptidase (beta-lactamase class C family)